MERNTRPDMQVEIKDVVMRGGTGVLLGAGRCLSAADGALFSFSAALIDNGVVYAH